LYRDSKKLLPALLYFFLHTCVYCIEYFNTEEIKTKCRMIKETKIKEKEIPDNSSIKCIRERDSSVSRQRDNKKALDPN